ncbi:TetR/AcrR family transcriptional regulator [Ahrensia marina]|uniref:TetR/AcrR family transcriptional regulator n=1 Tax=Ahrensia marina TaxID=1514904 RepID=UPI0035CFBE06
MTNGAETRVRQSRAKILAAAEDVFLRHGFLGANMDAVADVAGVSKQTVYAHGKSKEALFIQVVESMTGDAAEDIGEDEEDDFAGVTAGQFFLDAGTQQLLVVMTPRLMRLRRLVIGEVERFPELGHSLYENGVKRSVARYARAVEHFDRIGELRCDDHAAAANHFNWLLMGAPTNSAMFLGDAGIPSNNALEAHAQESVRIFLAAFRSAS